MVEKKHLAAKLLPFLSFDIVSSRCDPKKDQFQETFWREMPNKNMMKSTSPRPPQAMFSFPEGHRCHFIRLSTNNLKAGEYPKMNPSVFFWDFPVTGRLVWI